MRRVVVHVTDAGGVDGWRVAVRTAEAGSGTEIDLVAPYRMAASVVMEATCQPRLHERRSSRCEQALVAQQPCGGSPVESASKIFRRKAQGDRGMG